ncbi:MAG: phage tail protein, partial [Pseudomonadota bacterium]
PRTIKLSYVARDGDYAAEIAEARRTTRYSSRESTAELALMLDERDAGAIAATWLYETWAQRERAALSLPPSAMALEPGDQILLDVGNRQLPVRISDIADHGPRAIDAVSVDRDVYSGVQGATRETAVPAAPLSGKVDLHFLDLPLLSGTESPEAAYIAASQTPWPGAISVYKTATESGYQLATTIAAPAVMGRLQSVMPTGVGHRWNHGASVDVKLTAGALEGRSQIDVINGSNVAAVQHVDGQWEVIQFASAKLIGPRTYRLSTFLRGQSGTETAAMSETAAGAAFVLLNGRVARLDLSPSDIKRAFSWRYGPAGRDFGGPDFRRASHAFDGVGARPFAPVHVRGARSPAGLALSWTRRTRAGGDSWEQREVPLAEDGELYEVDILNGETVVRTLTSGAPAATYAAADAAADFGAMPEAVTCRIYQVGASYGRGTPAIATV